MSLIGLCIDGQCIVWMNTLTFKALAGIFIRSRRNAMFWAVSFWRTESHWVESQP